MSEHIDDLVNQEPSDYRELEKRLRQIADYEVIGNNKQAQVGALRDAADAIRARGET